MQEMQKILHDLIHKHPQILRDMSYQEGTISEIQESYFSFLKFYSSEPYDKLGDRTMQINLA